MKRIAPVLFAILLSSMFALSASAQGLPLNPTDSISVSAELPTEADTAKTNAIVAISFGEQIRREDGERLLKVGLPVTVSIPGAVRGTYVVRTTLSHHVGEGQPVIAENFLTVKLDEQGQGTFELSLSVPYELVGRAWLTQYRFEGSLAEETGSGKKIAGVVQFSNNGAKIVGAPVTF